MYHISFIHSAVDGWVKQGMGIQEYTYCDEYLGFFVSAGSLYCKPKTSITLYGN